MEKVCFKIFLKGFLKFYDDDGVGSFKVEGCFRFGKLSLFLDFI